LATSEEIQGLVAQGRTVAETIEIARDVTRKLIEKQGFPAGMVIAVNPVELTMTVLKQEADNADS
jgi:hypothetical protein